LETKIGGLKVLFSCLHLTDWFFIITSLLKLIPELVELPCYPSCNIKQYQFFNKSKNITITVIYHAQAFIYACYSPGRSKILHFTLTCDDAQYLSFALHTQGLRKSDKICGRSKFKISRSLLGR
jgi:hypothetical protein